MTVREPEDGSLAGKGEVRYRLHEPAGWVEKVARFEQRAPEEYGDIIALVGDCPRCDDRMDVELPIEKRTGKALKRIKKSQNAGEERKTGSGEASPADYGELAHSFVKTASCNCRGEHAGRAGDVGEGCGAFGRLEIRPARNDDSFVEVKGRPNVATLADMEWEHKAERLEAEELSEARAKAQKWTAAVGSLTGGITALALLNGTGDLNSVPRPWDLIALGLGVGALVSIGFAIICGAIASYGAPRAKRRHGGPLRREHARDARTASRLLMRSVLGTVVAVCFVVAAAVAAAASMPKEEPPPQPDDDPISIRSSTLGAFDGPVEIQRVVPEGDLCALRFAQSSASSTGVGPWWAACEDAEKLNSVAEVRERLALPRHFQRRINVRLEANIPEGMTMDYLEGKVAPQCKHETKPCPAHYRGGATQYYFPDTTEIDPWIGERCRFPIDGDDSTSCH